MTAKTKYHTTLANYFSTQSHFFDGELQKKPHIRKCMEQPWQQTNAEMWDEATETLCDLDFMQAKSCAKQTYDLIEDINRALEKIPDYNDEAKKGERRQQKIDKYIKLLIGCSNGNNSIKDLKILDSAYPLTNSQIFELETKEYNHATNNTLQLKEFKNFLIYESANFNEYCDKIKNFCLQQAWNYASKGIVGNYATKIINKRYKNLRHLMLLYHNFRPRRDAFPFVLKSVEFKTSEIQGICLTPDAKSAVIVGTSECLVVDIRLNKVLKRLIRKPSFEYGIGNFPFIDFSITPDGKYGISESEDHLVIVWDIEKEKILNTFQLEFEHVDRTCKVNISADGKKVISSNGNECIIWDAVKGIPINRLQDEVFMDDYCFTQDFNTILTTSGKNIVVWNLEKNKSKKYFKGHTENVENINITSDGSKVISCSNNDECFVWSMETGNIVKKFNDIEGCGFSFFISSDGKLAVSTKQDESYTEYSLLWDLEEGKCVKRFNQTIDVLTPDFSYGVTIYNYNIELIDIEKGNSTTELENKRVVFNEDRSKAITCTEEKTILWDAKSEEVLKKIEEIFVDNSNNFDYNNIILTSDAKKIIFSKIEEGSKHSIYSYDFSNKSFTKLSKEPLEYLDNMNLSLDENRLITSSPVKISQILNLSKKSITQVLEGHGDWVTCACISNDGMLAITSSRDYKCILWDLVNGKIIHQLIGHTNFVETICFSPDGTKAVSGSWDKTCIVWDIRIGKKLNIFREHSDWIDKIKITQDGTRVISSAGNKTIIWELYTGKIINLSVKSDNFKFDNSLLFPNTPFVTLFKSVKKDLQEESLFGIWCPHCGKFSLVNKNKTEQINNISKEYGLKSYESQCLILPLEAWERSELFSNCSFCNNEIRYNPFLFKEPDTKDLFNVLDPSEFQDYLKGKGICGDSLINALGVYYLKKNLLNEALNNFKKITRKGTIGWQESTKIEYKRNLLVTFLLLKKIEAYQQTLKDMDIEEVMDKGVQEIIQSYKNWEEEINEEVSKVSFFKRSKLKAELQKNKPITFDFEIGELDS